MAGEQSIAKQEYYANKGNLFWKILFSIFEEEFSASYEDRKVLLAKYNIGLWNVLKSCKREGSSDATITEETINDFENLHKQFQLRKVFFTSAAQMSPTLRFFMQQSIKPFTSKSLRLYSKITNEDYHEKQILNSKHLQLGYLLFLYLTILDH
nr:DNA-deoxyinosine glycosylase [Flavobacterium nitrogenifigens]